MREDGLRWEERSLDTSLSFSSFDGSTYGIAITAALEQDMTS